MKLILVLIWMSLFAISFYRRIDLFSPLKMFLFNIVVFWGAIFYVEYSYKMNLYFISIMLFGFFIWYFEGSDKKLYHFQKIIIPNRRKIWWRLWILTTIPVFFQLLLIQAMGGIEDYIFSMTLRVVEWQGYGVHILMIRSILVINLLYFIIIIKADGVTKLEVVGFLFNFLIFVGLALMTSSRSTLLVNISLMLITYYYFHKKIAFIKIAFFSIVLLFTALVLGVARKGYSIKEGKLNTGLSNTNVTQSLEISNFTYGVFPLEQILDANSIKNLYYGKTYLSVFTNVIPRSIWPKKPDTGGVVFTKDYHDVHGGYSNYSTGFIVEGIINFGYLPGFIFAFLLLTFTYLLFFFYVFKKNTLRNLIIYFAVYPNLLFLIPTYLHGEFTTVSHSIFLNKILLIIIFTKFIIPSNQKYKITD